MKDTFIDEGGGLRPWVSYTAIVLAVAGGGYWVYAAWVGQGGQIPVARMCYTEGCTYQTEQVLQLGEPSIGKCPRCSNDSVVAAFRCPGCGTANIWNEDRGLPPPTRCTKCGQEVRHGA